MNRPSSAIWDKVAKNYTSDFKVFDRDLAQEMTRIFERLGVEKHHQVIELGAGSGHISGLLAQSGYNVTLLDFSADSLAKAQELFQRHSLKGQFIKKDIFELGDKSYYLTWNSGVMEHFDHAALFEALSAINKATESFFVFLVPNAESLPYLLYRYKMSKQGKWNVGDEFLRLNYESYIKAAGFELLEKRYMGWEITKNFFEYFEQNKVNIQAFNHLIDEKLVPPSSAYLVCYICRKVGAPDDALHQTLVAKDDTDAITRKFDKASQ